MDTELVKIALQRAVDNMGSQVALSTALGIAQPNVAKWLKTGIIPPHWILKIEAASGVSRHELRPDIYPIEDKG